ncbi:hypothetical protein D3C75_1000650 [compost metagenome]
MRHGGEAIQGVGKLLRAALVIEGRGGQVHAFQLLLQQVCGLGVEQLPLGSAQVHGWRRLGQDCWPVPSDALQQLCARRKRQ